MSDLLYLTSKARIEHAPYYNQLIQLLTNNEFGRLISIINEDNIELFYILLQQLNIDLTTKFNITEFAEKDETFYTNLSHFISNSIEFITNCDYEFSYTTIKTKYVIINENLLLFCIQHFDKLDIKDIKDIQCLHTIQDRHRSHHNSILSIVEKAQNQELFKLIVQHYDSLTLQGVKTSYYYIEVNKIVKRYISDTIYSTFLYSNK